MKENSPVHQLGNFVDRPWGVSEIGGNTDVLYFSLVVFATWLPPLTSMGTRLILLSCIAVSVSLRQWFQPG